MIITTNVSSLTAQEAATNTGNSIKSSLEKLSSGLKINKASDDASGLAIADKLRTQASSIDQGIANGNSAVTLLQIADKSMAEQSNILDTIKSKLIQANTATTSADGRESIRKDITKLLEQLDNIAEQTNYNGNSLLQAGDSQNGSNALSFQIGESNTDIIENTSIKSNSIGLGGGSQQLIQTSGAANQNNLVADGSALIINSNLTKDIDDNGAVGGTGDIDAIKITAQTTGATPAGADIGIINISADKIDTIKAGSGDLNVKFDDRISALIQDKINAAETGFAATDITYDSDKDEFTLLNGGNFSMKDLGSVGSMQIELATDSATAELNITGEVRNLSINNTDDIKLNGDASASTTTNNTLKVTSTNVSGLSGGQSLASLASLGSGELTAEKSSQYQGVIDSAITTLNGYRGDIGSTQNQVESAVRNLMTQSTNVKAAESIIRDVDYAEESANFNKQNIISQAGSYAISQANSVQQNVLKLLQ